MDYTGERVQAAAKESGIDVELVKHSDEAKGFVAQPKRWIGFVSEFLSSQYGLELAILVPLTAWFAVGPSLRYSRALLSRIRCVTVVLHSVRDNHAKSKDPGVNYFTNFRGDSS